MTPGSNEAKRRYLSLRQDSKVESITKIPHGYIGTTPLHSYIIGITTYDRYNFEKNTISKLIKKQILLVGSTLWSLARVR
jgi:hypothetical protein